MSYLEPGSPEQQIEQRCASLIREIDDLMVLAADPATASFVIRQARAIGQVLNRAQLIASFIEARKEPKLKVIGSR